MRRRRHHALRRRYGHTHHTMATRDYEWVVYPSTIVSGEGITIRPSSLTRGLDKAKAVAKEHPGSGIYSVSHGRFVGWINFKGRYVPFR